MVKRIVAIGLVVVLLLCFASSALAITGTVSVSTWLNLRKKASTSSTIIAYMKNGTVVQILDNANITNGFYRIKGESYTNHHNWTGKATRTGYGSANYIQ